MRDERFILEVIDMYQDLEGSLRNAIGEFGSLYLDITP